MNEFAAYLENLAFSNWIKETGSVWAWTLFLHTLGMGIVAGGSTMLNLILLGFWPSAPIKPFARVFPVMWLAFGLNAITGTMMLLADATNKLLNPDFYVKMVLVFAGLFVLVRMDKLIFKNPQLDQGPPSPRAKMLAWASLVCWFGAITAGRLLAYIGNKK
jgi:hypothetical protein